MADEHFADRAPVERVPELELRTAILRDPFDGWPAGTTGVVVDAYEHDATVEITGESGITLALLTVPYDRLTILDRVEQTRLAL